MSQIHSELWEFSVNHFLVIRFLFNREFLHHYFLNPFGNS
jgi:hypothetical protein